MLDNDDIRDSFQALLLDSPVDGPLLSASPPHEVFIGEVVSIGLALFAS
jgi:hypothetical protein